MGWLVGCLVGRLVGWLVGCFVALALASLAAASVPLCSAQKNVSSVAIQSAERGRAGPSSHKLSRHRRAGRGPGGAGGRGPGPWARWAWSCSPPHRPTSSSAADGWALSTEAAGLLPATSTHFLSQDFSTRLIHLWTTMGRSVLQIIFPDLHSVAPVEHPPPATRHPADSLGFKLG